MQMLTGRMDEKKAHSLATVAEETGSHLFAGAMCS